MKTKECTVIHICQAFVVKINIASGMLTDVHTLVKLNTNIH